jgi:hypothetical protein
MGFQLPKALQTADNKEALSYLKCYYQERPGTPLGALYTGARFDTWDSTGTRSADVNRFTSDDLVAVSFLSVVVPPKAAWELLSSKPDEFNNLLTMMPNQELAEVSPEAINPAWAPWCLWERLRGLRGVDWVIASKLLARKRPRLIPIYDRVVKTVTGGDANFWVPLCTKLRENDGVLHDRLLLLRHEAGLPPCVSALRVFDVIAWMEGQDHGL